MREISEDLKTEKNKLDQTRPWLDLYELWLAEDGSERMCHVFHDEPITWDGRLYRPYPIVRGKTSQSSDGELAQWPLAVSTLDPVVVPLLNEHGGFLEKRVRVIRVHKDFLDDPSTAQVESARIATAQQDDSEGVIKFSLGQVNLSEEKVAWRTFGGRCDYRYKDPRTCRYAGALPACDHSLAGPNGCAVHGADSVNHPKFFGGQPSVPRGG
jgi:phage-related protein